MLGATSLPILSPSLSHLLTATETIVGEQLSFTFKTSTHTQFWSFNVLTICESMMYFLIFCWWNHACNARHYATIKIFLVSRSSHGSTDEAISSRAGGSLQYSAEVGHHPNFIPPGPRGWWPGPIPVPPFPHTHVPAPPVPVWDPAWSGLCPLFSTSALLPGCTATGNHCTQLCSHVNSINTRLAPTTPSSI